MQNYPRQLERLRFYKETTCCECSIEYFPLSLRFKQRLGIEYTFNDQKILFFQ